MRWLAASGAVVLVVVIAVVAVLATRGSPGGVKVPQIQPATARAGAPPLPPRGALALARGHGDFAVGLAARRSGGELRLTATVVAPDGNGLRGLRLHFAVDGASLPQAAPCGAGCYASSTRATAPARHVTIAFGGHGRAPARVGFALPAHWPVSAAPLLRGAERAFARLSSVVYHERLSSGRGAPIVSVWRSEAPDRLSYESMGGNAGVIIGRNRWDRVVGGGWKRGRQNPPLELPVPPWGAGAYDVSLLGGGRVNGRAVVRFSMFEPTTPAWYTVTLDRKTLRAVTVDMTATAHFMQDRYVAFGVPRQIRPPAGR